VKASTFDLFISLFALSAAEPCPVEALHYPTTPQTVHVGSAWWPRRNDCQSDLYYSLTEESRGEPGEPRRAKESRGELRRAEEPTVSLAIAVPPLTIITRVEQK